MRQAVRKPVSRTRLRGASSAAMRTQKPQAWNLRLPLVVRRNSLGVARPNAPTV